MLSLDDIPRFKKLGVIPTHQTVFLRTDKKVAEARIGRERMKGAYAWRTMYCAVTRMDENGQPEGGWYPQEAMTREEALRSYTTWGAYAGFEEKLKGSIETGKLADFIVIDRDFMTCPAEEIKDIQVLETVLGGETVYKK